MEVVERYEKNLSLLKGLIAAQDESGIAKILKG